MLSNMIKSFSAFTTVLTALTVGTALFATAACDLPATGRYQLLEGSSLCDGKDFENIVLVDTQSDEGLFALPFIEGAQGFFRAVPILDTELSAERFTFATPSDGNVAGRSVTLLANDDGVLTGNVDTCTQSLTLSDRVFSAFVGTVSCPDTETAPFKIFLDSAQKTGFISTALDAPEGISIFVAFTNTATDGSIDFAEEIVIQNNAQAVTLDTQRQGDHVVGTFLLSETPCQIDVIPEANAQ